MADIRVIELAKALKVETQDVLRVAQECGIAASGPTGLLTGEDRQRIEQALARSGDGRRASASGRGSTLTLKRPLSVGAARGNDGGQGKTVTVEVRRRRRHRPLLQAPGKGGVASSTPAPAQPEQRAASVESEKRQAPPAPGKGLSPVEAARSRLKENAEREALERQRKSAQAREMRRQREAARAGDARPGSAGRSPDGRRAVQGADQRSGRPGSASGNRGPRTTIRKGGLTPAQIAAAKAPRSSLRDIEAKIGEERAQQRRQRRDAAPGDAASRGGGVRRAPSVAVAGDMVPPAGGGGRKKGGRGQQPLSRRRLSPAEKAARRSYAAKRNELLTEEQEERMARLARGGSRRSKRITKNDEAFVVRDVEIYDPMLVSDLASRMAVKSAEVVKILFGMGVTVTVNEAIDAETAQLVVEEVGHRPKVINEAEVEESLSIDEEEMDESDLQPRPPVVVVMGHVDHGKTSILDALRKANVAAGEAGGITQHIGAYMVKLESGDRVVFVDTPGHEAFTTLRARGAELTDVAVLVVAADDGVKPQTVEALNHARSAGVPIIVAVNKIDKEGADVEKVKRQLAEHEVVPEDWGGDTIFVPVSAHTGEGLDELLEMLALQTELLELRASPNARARGFVIESRLDKGRGPVATVLVQNGTFKKGDIVVVGSVMGRIRAIIDENSVQHRTAGPSIPFELLGLESVPEAGTEILAVEDEKKARELVRYREDKRLNRHMPVAVASPDGVKDMNALFAAARGETAIEVPILIKGDVTGSVEALAESLIKLGTDEVKVKVIHKAIGGIKESDVMLASAAGAILIGFNVRPDVKAKRMAAAEGVDIRFYTVIYDAIDEVKAAMAGKLSPDEVEKVIGTAEVREVFSVPKIGAVAGCYVTDGLVHRKARVRVLRDGVLVYTGELASLRRFKDDVREVRAGYECGIGIDKFNDIKVGDNFEFFEIEEVAATL